MEIFSFQGLGMLNRSVRILALILILASSTRSGRAEPMHTYLVDALAQSETIAVSRSRSPSSFAAPRWSSRCGR
jgi:hypothetical protein